MVIGLHNKPKNIKLETEDKKIALMCHDSITIRLEVGNSVAITGYATIQDLINNFATVQDLINSFDTVQDLLNYKVTRGK